MTLVSTIIKDAYRESNLIAIASNPNSNQLEEALRLLNRMISSVYGNEAGDQLNPLPIGNNNVSRPSGYNATGLSDFVPVNSQLVMNVTNPMAVWLHPRPADGARFGILDKSSNLATYPLTVYGNGRTIESSSSKVYNTNTLAVEFMYRADTGNWYKVSDLTSTDEMPFPDDFDDVFTIGLAIRLNPRYQQSIDEQSVATYRRALTQFKARYRQVIQMSSEWGLLLTPGTSGDRDFFSNIDEFNTGRVFPLRY